MTLRSISFRGREKMECIHLLWWRRRRNHILSFRISKRRGLRNLESLVWTSFQLILGIMEVISFVLIRNSTRPTMSRRTSLWRRALSNQRIHSLRLRGRMRSSSLWMILVYSWIPSSTRSKRITSLWIFPSLLLIFLLLETTAWFYARESYKSSLSVVFVLFSWPEEMHLRSGDQYPAYY